MTSSSSIDTARLIASALSAPRFGGRTAVLRLAETGDATALRALDASSPREREILALSGALSEKVAKALAIESVSAAASARADRAERAKGLEVPRQPGKALERCTLAAFRSALKRAGFRKATHSHHTAIAFGDRGAESALSSVGQLRPSDAGLPTAYSRKGFFVTSSTHEWAVSANFLRVPAAERAAEGVIYLSPVVRVVQGRGTSLVVERRTGTRGGWR